MRNGIKIFVVINFLTREDARRMCLRIFRIFVSEVNSLPLLISRVDLCRILKNRSTTEFMIGSRKNIFPETKLRLQVKTSLVWAEFPPWYSFATVVRNPARIHRVPRRLFVFGTEASSILYLSSIVVYPYRLRVASSRRAQPRLSDSICPTLSSLLKV